MLGVRWLLVRPSSSTVFNSVWNKSHVSLPLKLMVDTYIPSVLEEVLNKLAQLVWVLAISSTLNRVLCFSTTLDLYLNIHCFSNGK